METIVPSLSGQMVTAATTISVGARDMIIAVIPLLAPVVGGVIVTKLGFRFIKRFSS